MGIEPTSSAWKAEVLPLNYTRLADIQLRTPPQPCRRVNGGDVPKIVRRAYSQHSHSPRFLENPNRFRRLPTTYQPCYSFQTSLSSSATTIEKSDKWWRGVDSNHRRQSRQIYSLFPLAAREPLPEKEPCILLDRPYRVNIS